MKLACWRILSVTELPHASSSRSAASSLHFSLAHMGASSYMRASSPCFHMAENLYHSAASPWAVPAAAGEGNDPALCLSLVDKLLMDHEHVTNLGKV